MLIHVPDKLMKFAVRLAFAVRLTQMVKLAQTFLHSHACMVFLFVPASRKYILKKHTSVLHILNICSNALSLNLIREKC